MALSKLSKRKCRCGGAFLPASAGNRALQGLGKWAQMKLLSVGRWFDPSRAHHLAASAGTFTNYIANAVPARSRRRGAAQSAWNILTRQALLCAGGEHA